MKTVYEYFTVFASALLAERTDYSKELLEQGIRAYLSEIGITGEPLEGANRVARRELMRFKLMPPATFIAFFENYEQRLKIAQLVRECDLLAISRLRNDKTIDESVYNAKVNELYTLASGLSLDSRYRGWLDEVTQNAMISLKFAHGISNEISENVIMRAELSF